MKSTCTSTDDRLTHTRGLPSPCTSTTFHSRDTPRFQNVHGLRASPTPFDTADSSSGLCWQPRWKAIRKLTGLTSFKRVAILALQTPFTQCVRYCALPYPSIARSTFSPPLPIIIKLNQRQQTKCTHNFINYCSRRKASTRYTHLRVQDSKNGEEKGEAEFLFRFSFLRTYFGFGLDWLLGTNFWKYAVNTLRKLHGVDSITLSIMQKLNPRKTVEVLNLLHFVPRKVWNRLYAFNVSFYYGYSLN